MKFLCPCGATLIDSSDSHSHKAHFIADQDWFGLLDEFDSILQQVEAGDLNEESASMKLRKRLNSLSRTMYQCRECGGLHVSDHRQHLQFFSPANQITSKGLLRGEE